MKWMKTNATKNEETKAMTTREQDVFHSEEDHSQHSLMEHLAEAADAAEDAELHDRLGSALAAADDSDDAPPTPPRRRAKADDGEPAVSPGVVAEPRVSPTMSPDPSPLQSITTSPSAVARGLTHTRSRQPIVPESSLDEHDDDGALNTYLELEANQRRAQELEEQQLQREVEEEQRRRQNEARERQRASKHDDDEFVFTPPPPRRTKRMRSAEKAAPLESTKTVEAGALSAKAHDAQKLTDEAFDSPNSQFTSSQSPTKLLSSSVSTASSNRTQSQRSQSSQRSSLDANPHVAAHLRRSSQVAGQMVVDDDDDDDDEGEENEDDKGDDEGDDNSDAAMAAAGADENDASREQANDSSASDSEDETENHKESATAALAVRSFWTQIQGANRARTQRRLSLSTQLSRRSPASAVTPHERATAAEDEEHDQSQSPRRPPAIDLAAHDDDDNDDDDDDDDDDDNVAEVVESEAASDGKRDESSAEGAQDSALDSAAQERKRDAAIVSESSVEDESNNDAHMQSNASATRDPANASEAAAAPVFDESPPEPSPALASPPRSPKRQTNAASSSATASTKRKRFIESQDADEAPHAAGSSAPASVLLGGQVPLDACRLLIKLLMSLRHSKSLVGAKGFRKRFHRQYRGAPVERDLFRAATAKLEQIVLSVGTLPEGVVESELSCDTQPANTALELYECDNEFDAGRERALAHRFVPFRARQRFAATRRAELGLAAGGVRVLAAPLANYLWWPALLDNDSGQIGIVPCTVLETILDEDLYRKSLLCLFVCLLYF